MQCKWALKHVEEHTDHWHWSLGLESSEYVKKILWQTDLVSGRFSVKSSVSQVLTVWWFSFFNCFQSIFVVVVVVQRLFKLNFTLWILSGMCCCLRMCVPQAAVRAQKGEKGAPAVLESVSTIFLYRLHIKAQTQWAANLLATLTQFVHSS